MADPNHNIAFRPLRAGTAIFNPKNNEAGCLGCFGTTGAGDAWIVSCFHVLARSKTAGGVFASNEPVMQPTPAEGAVATTDTTRADALLDCAAALVTLAVPPSREILGIGAIRPPLAPAVGVPVIKSGPETGVTHGVITQVNGSQVRIEPPQGFPTTYIISKIGDSGSLWVREDTHEAIALHLAGSGFGARIAFALDIAAVMTALRLQLLT